MSKYILPLGTKLGDMPPSLQNFWKRDFPDMYTFGYNLDQLEAIYGARARGCARAGHWVYAQVEFPDEESYMRFVLEWS